MSKRAHKLISTSHSSRPPTPKRAQPSGSSSAAPAVEKLLSKCEAELTEIKDQLRVCTSAVRYNTKLLLGLFAHFKLPVPDPDSSDEPLYIPTRIDLTEELETTEALHNDVRVKQCEDSHTARTRQAGDKTTATTRVTKEKIELDSELNSDDVNALVNSLKEKDEELEHLKALNQILLMKERTSNDELVEAYQFLINGWKAFSDRIYVVGIKRMGELDPKPFRDACYEKYQVAAVAEEKALQLCSLWQSKLSNPSWHPFKVVENDSGEAKEIIDNDDEQLEELKRDYGSAVYVSVCQALKELNEYNPSGRYPVGVLWDYKENKRATLKEAIDILLKMKMVPS